jgi:hypothetical protein
MNIVGGRKEWQDLYSEKPLEFQAAINRRKQALGGTKPVSGQ